MLGQDAVQQAVEVPQAVVAAPARRLRAIASDYLALTKPRIVGLLLVTTIPAMIMAHGGWPSVWLMLLTLAGDTLVGPWRAPLSELRPGVVLAGVYAANRAWFEAGEPITFEERSYGRNGAALGLDCGDIRQVGEHLGVPLFVTGIGGGSQEILFVPEHPGVWQRYSLEPG